MLLARRGHRVLLLDKSTFPSDTISTHHIHQPGVARLKRWGLPEKVRASNVPPTTDIIFDLGAYALRGMPSPPLTNLAASVRLASAVHASAAPGRTRPALPVLDGAPG